MAATGHGATQAPQPVHDVASTAGVATPPTASAKRMAEVSHCSPHTRQVTPAADRQAEEMTARKVQGALVDPRTRAPGAQAATQASQKVQAPCAKETSG
jgi:hypothetical protein